MKITSINIQESLLKKIKRRAAEESRSVSAMVRLLLEQSLSNSQSILKR